MPGKNGTGPDGQGSGTGRKLGRCKSSIANESNETMEVGQRRRRFLFNKNNDSTDANIGRGRGRGFANRNSSKRGRNN